MNKNNCDSILPHQVRKIKPTRRSVSGHYVFREKTSIAYESTLERDFIIRSEFNLNVLNIIPQPLQMTFIKNGRKYPYTPDFLVYYQVNNTNCDFYLKPMLVEVKPRLQIQEHWSEWRDKFRTAFHYAKENDWDFRIYDESRIRDQVLKNINALERFKYQQYSSNENNAVIETVRQSSRIIVQDLLISLFEPAKRFQGVAHVWHLLVTRKLDCDMSLPLSELTELWVPNNE